jgi:hypothetical protein
VGKGIARPADEVSLEVPHVQRHFDFMTESGDAREIPWGRFPELATLCWNLHRPSIPAKEALRLYEDHWRFVNQAAMTPAEKELVNRLADRFGSFLHVPA